LSVILS